MKNKLLLKGKRRSKRKKLSWNAKHQHLEVRPDVEKKIWCWRFSLQDVNTKMKSNNNLYANEKIDKIYFDSSDLQSNHCN